jgi:hypothetical protein
MVKIFIGRRKNDRGALEVLLVRDGTGLLKLPEKVVKNGEHLEDSLRECLPKGLGAKIKLGRPYCAFDEDDKTSRVQTFKVIYFGGFSKIDQIKVGKIRTSNIVWVTRAQIDKLDIEKRELEAIKAGFGMVG